MLPRLLHVGLVVAVLVVLPFHLQAEERRIDTLEQLFLRLKSCWKPPMQLRDRPGIEITVLVTFTRDGAIFGQPKVTYESAYATEDDRLMYRRAVASALQRCTPMPFSKGLGNAIAGRPFRFTFDDRRTKSTEMRSWQTTKTL